MRKLSLWIVHDLAEEFANKNGKIPKRILAGQQEFERLDRGLHLIDRIRNENNERVPHCIGIPVRELPVTSHFSFEG